LSTRSWKIFQLRPALSIDVRKQHGMTDAIEVAVIALPEYAASGSI
jgi:hypothetical protein